MLKTTKVYGTIRSLVGPTPSSKLLPYSHVPSVVRSSVVSRQLHRAGTAAVRNEAAYQK